MPVIRHDSEPADLNLTSLVTVLTHTPNASADTICQGYVAFGDGVKNLDGTGGDFEFTITVGGQTIQPDDRNTDAQQPVTLQQRTLPLVQMLSAATRQECDVMWEKGASPV